jgi:hypothetical protein
MRKKEDFVGSNQQISRVELRAGVLCRALAREKSPKQKPFLGSLR